LPPYPVYRRARAWLSAREVSGYNCTRLALGLLLLIAAALKGHQLATEPVPETGLLTSRWFLIGVVEFELFFGLWLLSGLYPKWTWRAALGTTRRSYSAPADAEGGCSILNVTSFRVSLSRFPEVGDERTN